MAAHPLKIATPRASHCKKAAGGRVMCTERGEDLISADVLRGQRRVERQWSYSAQTQPWCDLCYSSISTDVQLTC